MIHLVVIDEVLLPVVREAEPEETEHVGDDHCENRHFEDLHDGQDSTIIGNLVITMLVAVTGLHLVQDLLLWNKIVRSNSGDSDHFEYEQVALQLLFLFSIVRQKDPPWHEGQYMEEEAVVEDVSFGDQFETVNNIIVLGIAVRCEELLNNLEEEEDLTEL